MQSKKGRQLLFLRKEIKDEQLYSIIHLFIQIVDFWINHLQIYPNIRNNLYLFFLLRGQPLEQATKKLNATFNHCL